RTFAECASGSDCGDACGVVRMTGMGLAAFSVKAQFGRMAEHEFPYLAGVADIDVTPRVGSKLAGFAARTADSTGVYLPLRCIATALTDRETERTLLLISIEWLGFYDNTVQVRTMVSA